MTNGKGSARRPCAVDDVAARWAATFGIDRGSVSGRLRHNTTPLEAGDEEEGWQGRHEEGVLTSEGRACASR